MPPKILVDLPIVRHSALNFCIEIVAGFDRQSLPQIGILLHKILQMRRDRVQRRALGEVEPTDRPPGPMSAPGGSGRAAPKEEVRV